MANFRSDSGNSTKGVEMIAVIRPDRVAYKKDENGNRTSEVSAQYVDVMVNNSALKKAEVQAGKGQEQPNLYAQKVSYTTEAGEEKQSFKHEIRMSFNQVEAIKAAGKGKSLEKEDGTLYVPFKADVMGLNETVKDKDGKAVMNEKGEPQKHLVGYMPNTKTIQPTELGNLTQNRLDKHFANTKTLNEVKNAQRAAAKDAKMAETATKAPEMAEPDAGLDYPF